MSVLEANPGSVQLCLHQSMALCGTEAGAQSTLGWVSPTTAWTIPKTAQPGTPAGFSHHMPLEFLPNPV